MFGGGGNAQMACIAWAQSHEQEQPQERAKRFRRKGQRPNRKQSQGVDQRGAYDEQRVRCPEVSERNTSSVQL